MEVIPGHPDQNTAKILSMIADAKKQSVDLIIFPEMAVPGYLLGDTWEQSSFLKDCERYGQDIIDASTGITVMFGNIAIDWSKRTTTAACANTTPCLRPVTANWSSPTTCHIPMSSRR